MSDKRFTTASLVFVGIGSLLAGGILIGVIVGPKGPGDTPVILVGDSMKFKAGVSISYPWVEDTHYVTYHTVTDSQPKLIVVKQNTGSDNDVLRINVPSIPWEIDEFVVGNSSAVVSITPYPSGSASPTGLSATLKMGQPGVLCPVTSQPYVEIDYFSDTCRGTAVHISKISILASINGGALQEVGTLDCVDATGTANHCKIQFRE